MIRATSLSKSPILHDVTLEVPAGEVLCVVGPNGAGKSTLLKLLSGEWLPTGGIVELNGKPLSQWPERERAKVLAVLPQISTLAADFTALEVVLMGRTPHMPGAETPHDRTIAREALAATQASHLEQQIYTRLSGGEQQSIQLARVLSQIWNCPHANLLLDEPIANLDPAQQHRMLAIARTFAQTGVAVMIILHDLNLAAQYADRIAILKAGTLTAYGVPSEALTPPSILQNFRLRVTVIPHPTRAVPMVIPE